MTDQTIDNKSDHSEGHKCLSLLLNILKKLAEKTILIIILAIFAIVEISLLISIFTIFMPIYILIAVCLLFYFGLLLGRRINQHFTKKT